MRATGAYGAAAATRPQPPRPLREHVVSSAPRCRRSRFDPARLPSPAHDKPGCRAYARRRAQDVVQRHGQPVSRAAKKKKKKMPNDAQSIARECTTESTTDAAPITRQSRGRYARKQTESFVADTSLMCVTREPRCRSYATSATQMPAPRREVRLSSARRRRERVFQSALPSTVFRPRRDDHSTSVQRMTAIRSRGTRRE